MSDTKQTRNNANHVCRPWTRFAQLGGLSITGFKTLSMLIERAQIVDRTSCEASRWDDYPTNRYGWLALGHRSARFLGIGHENLSVRLSATEHLYRIELPWRGCGRDLAEKVGIYNLHRELVEQYGKSSGRPKKGARCVA